MLQIFSMPSILHVLRASIVSSAVNNQTVPVHSIPVRSRVACRMAALGNILGNIPPVQKNQQPLHLGDLKWIFDP